MQRRYVSSDSDLPTHDLVLEMSGGLSGLACHVRHYLHRDMNLVIVGQLSGDVSPIANSSSIACDIATVVVPPGQEFTMTAALRHSLEHPEVPAVIAYDRTEACEFARYEELGIKP
jgi:hypothetical protein